MILNYNVTLEDVIAFSNAKYLTPVRIQQLSLNYFFLSSISMLLLTIFISVKEHNFGFIGLGILLIPIFFWYFRNYQNPFVAKEKKRIAKLVQKIYTQDVCDRILGPQELQIDEDHFTIKSKLSETRYSWKIVQDIIITEDHIFLQISPNTAEVVPKKVVGQQTFDELVTFLKIKAEGMTK
jgi:hypothetical protein